MIERRTPQFSLDDMADLVPLAGYTAIAVMVSLILFSWLDSVITTANRNGYPFATAAHHFHLATEDVHAGFAALLLPQPVGNNGVLYQRVFGTPTPQPTPGIVP